VLVVRFATSNCVSAWFGSAVNFSFSPSILWEGGFEAPIFAQRNGVLDAGFLGKNHTRISA